MTKAVPVVNLTSKKIRSPQAFELASRKVSLIECSVLAIRLLPYSRSWNAEKQMNKTESQQWKNSGSRVSKNKTLNAAKFLKS